MSISGFPNTHQYRPNSQRTHLGNDYSIDRLASRLIGLAIGTLTAVHLYNHMTGDDTSALQFEGLAISTAAASHLCTRITGHYDPLTLDEAAVGGLGMTVGSVAIISRTLNTPHTPHIYGYPNSQRTLLGNDYSIDSDLAIRLAGLAISTVAATYVYQRITDDHASNLQLANGVIGTLAIAHLCSISAAHLYTHMTSYDPLTLAQEADCSLGMLIGSVGAIRLWNDSTQALPRGVRQAGNTGPRLPRDVRQAGNTGPHLPGDVWMRSAATQDWLNRQPNTRDRDTAAGRIRQCMNRPRVTSLFLDSLNITSLPDHLNLPELTELSLSRCPITSLPDNLNLPRLERLNLSWCPITSLPDHLNPPNLNRLYLIGTQITSLPDHLNLPNLAELRLWGSPITHLPDNLNLPELTELSLSRSQIRSLPNNLNLPNLREFDLRGTQITGDYEGVFNLPRECRVLITRSNLSNLIQARINELQTHGGYDGPRIIEFHG